MSLYDFYKSREILDTNPTFAALIMAAAEKARTVSRAKLQATFPRIVGEFHKRRSTSIGLLDGDNIQITIESEIGLTATYNKIFREYKGEKICLK